MATKTQLGAILRNDTRTINVTITEDGSPLDITGYTIWFTVRDIGTLDNITSQTNDSDAVIHLENTVHTDPTNGVTTFILSKTDTNVDPKRYAYDVSMKDGSGNITTIVYGQVDIIADVTRST